MNPRPSSQTGYLRSLSCQCMSVRTQCRVEPGLRRFKHNPSIGHLPPSLRFHTRHDLKQFWKFQPDNAGASNRARTRRSMRCIPTVPNCYMTHVYGVTNALPQVSSLASITLGRFEPRHCQGETETDSLPNGLEASIDILWEEEPISQTSCYLRQYSRNRGSSYFINAFQSLR